MLATSYFAMAKYLTTPVSISHVVPKWYKGAVLKILAPSYELVQMYKSGNISQQVFTAEYKENTLKYLNAEDVYAYIKEKFGDDATLICYECAGEFCHRRIVADWLKKEVGVTIPELNIDDAFKKRFKESAAAVKKQVVAA